MLTAVIAFSISGSAVSEREPELSSPMGGIVSLSAISSRSETCRSARTGLRWYRGRFSSHRAKMGRGDESAGQSGSARTSGSLPGGAKAEHSPGRAASLPCPRIRYLASRWRTKAYAARRAAERWAAVHVLRDPEVRPGNDAWHGAVQEAQRAYPGTRGWLLSCSASEGGWGRWVPNSDGAPPGGWLQFYESTFWRMWATAKVDVVRRGFRVPRSAHSWYSPLGQALAGAWALTNGRRHEWAGYGC